MSTETANTVPFQEDDEDVYKAVERLNEQLKTMETFVARRFDEISMEINATAQQVDMAEDGIVKRFSEVLEILGAINYHGDHHSAANTGVELEAVIEDTENAANTILDAADRIVERVSNEKDWHDETKLDGLRETIKADIQEILLACTFQDLTGQRIRNTLQNLQEIETRISSTFDRLGIHIEPSKEAIESHITKSASQDDVDALFGGESKSS